ncbi:CSC1-like protein [Zea mays]|nr:CSC1-like protein [Zea mays]
MAMSKIEGHTSLSGLDRKTATKYYIFLFVNVFLGSVITGTAFQQLDNFIHQSANKIPEVVGESIPMKAAFFMTYIMVDGWSGIAAEVLRLKALVIFHIKNAFLIINVYTQHYESGAQFWPDVHMRLIIALIVSQILLLGLLSTQEAEKSTVALLPLPVLSIWFHYVCKGRFEPAFVKFPLQARPKN